VEQEDNIDIPEKEV